MRFFIYNDLRCGLQIAKGTVDCNKKITLDPCLCEVTEWMLLGNILLSTSDLAVSIVLQVVP